MTYTVINGLEDDIRFMEISENIKSLLDDTINSKNQIINWIDLRNNDIRYCIGCDYCQNVNPGQCALKDDQSKILKEFILSDTVLMITSVHFGCCNSLIKNFMDRSEPLFLPYQIAKGKGSVMKGRYEKYPKLIVLGIDDSGESQEKCFIKFMKNSTLSQVCPNTVVKVFSKEQQTTKVLRNFIEEELINE